MVGDGKKPQGKIFHLPRTMPPYYTDLAQSTSSIRPFRLQFDEAIVALMHLWYTSFFYKQPFYKQPGLRPQNIKGWTLLMGGRGCEDFSQKVC